MTLSEFSLLFVFSLIISLGKNAVSTNWLLLVIWLRFWSVSYFFIVIDSLNNDRNLGVMASLIFPSSFN